jgi:hypothetical protein
MSIVPILPTQTAAVADNTAADAEAVRPAPLVVVRRASSRRTFGRFTPSRRTFGRYTPSRRTFGRSSY